MAKLEKLKKDLEALYAEHAEKVNNLPAYDALINEGAGGYSHKDAIDQEYGEKQVEIIRQIRAEEFRLEWTMEVFEDRKSAYNTAIQALPNFPKAKVKDVADMEMQLGFSRDELLRAKKLLGA